MGKKVLSFEAIQQIILNKYNKREFDLINLNQVTSLSTYISS